MKKLFVITVLSLIAFALQAQGPGEQRALNKAEAAARSCINQLGIPNNLEIHSAATISTVCDYIHPNPQYYGYRVAVWGTPNCPANQPCIQIAYPIAEVEVSCSGQVVSVGCAVVGQ